MNQPLKRPAMAFLRWSVGLVVLWQSYQTFHMAYTKGHAPGHAGALTGVRLVLSGSEIVAAILFLAPSSTALGGYLLLLIFGLALALHTLHGDIAGLAVLIVYGAAVLVTLADRADPTSPSFSDTRSWPSAGAASSLSPSRPPLGHFSSTRRFKIFRLAFEPASCLPPEASF